jgi:hypothetical protein
MAAPHQLEDLTAQIGEPSAAAFAEDCGAVERVADAGSMIVSFAMKRAPVISPTVISPTVIGSAAIPATMRRRCHARPPIPIDAPADSIRLP